MAEDGNVNVLGPTLSVNSVVSTTSETADIHLDAEKPGKQLTREVRIIIWFFIYFIVKQENNSFEFYIQFKKSNLITSVNNDTQNWAIGTFIILG